MNEYINNKRVDGIIILSTFSIGEANVVRPHGFGNTFVLLGNQSAILSSNQILFDNYSAKVKLWITFMSWPQAYSPHKRFRKPAAYDPERQAYFDSLKRLDLEFQDEWVKYSNHAVDGGYKSMQEILDFENSPQP